MQVLGVTVGLPTPVPVLTGAVCASFTSPADDFVDDEIDHQRLLIANRPANLLVRVAGDSMLLARLRESDLALVDRSLTPRNGDVVVVDIDGERSFKGWWRQGPRVILSSANPRFPQVPPRTGRGGRSLGRGLGVDQPEAPHGISRANALSDGNSFYCSCERGFDAGLARVPVIVLSNNDGCAIARIPEAKALGIRKSEPFFGIHDMCRSQGVRVYSSNYALYGDISARMNTVYRGFSPRIEIYSIYQSILDLPIVREADRVTLCRDMREMVWSWTGIPTCVSIGSIKTLAKLANHVAKKVPKLGGLCDLTDPVQYDDWMGRIPPEDMRGVGPANARKLTALGCESVADVRDLDTRAVWKAMTVVGERLV